MNTVQAKSDLNDYIPEYYQLFWNHLYACQTSHIFDTPFPGCQKVPRHDFLSGSSHFNYGALKLRIG
jgi:hypothetical protein